MNEKSFGIIPVLVKDSKYQFLLIKHKSGHWAFPKGHPEKNEKELDTAKREFEEETGIKNYSLIENVSFIEKYTFNQDNGSTNKTVKYFIAAVKNQNINILKKEIQDYKWINYEEALELITYDESRKIIIEVLKHLNSRIDKINKKNCKLAAI